MDNANWIKLSPHIRFRRVADEGVVVDQRSAEVLVISEVAVRILELVRELGSPQAVVESICSEFDVSPDRATSDFVAFLEEFRALGFIHSGE